MLNKLKASFLWLLLVLPVMAAPQDQAEFKPPTPQQQARELLDQARAEVAKVPPEWQSYIWLNILTIESKVSKGENQEVLKDLLEKVWTTAGQLDSPRDRVIMKNNVSRYSGMLIGPELAIHYLKDVPPPVRDSTGFGGTAERPVYDDYRYLSLKQVGPGYINKFGWYQSCKDFLPFAKNWGKDGGQYPVFAVASLCLIPRTEEELKDPNNQALIQQIWTELGEGMRSHDWTKAYVAAESETYKTLLGLKNIASTSWLEVGVETFLSGLKVLPPRKSNYSAIIGGQPITDENDSWRAKVCGGIILPNPELKKRLGTKRCPEYTDPFDPQEVRTKQTPAVNDYNNLFQLRAGFFMEEAIGEDLPAPNWKKVTEAYDGLGPDWKVLGSSYFLTQWPDDVKSSEALALKDAMFSDARKNFLVLFEKFKDTDPEKFQVGPGAGRPSMQLESFELVARLAYVLKENPHDVAEKAFSKDFQVWKKHAGQDPGHYEGWYIESAYLCNLGKFISSRSVADKDFLVMILNQQLQGYWFLDAKLRVCAAEGALRQR